MAYVSKLLTVCILVIIIIGGAVGYRIYKEPVQIAFAGQSYDVRIAIKGEAVAVSSITPIGVLQGAQSLTAQQIDTILAECNNSPAYGTGADWVALGSAYGIDAAYALAFFSHESTCGTNTAWAGLKPDGTNTHNIGNIICAGYATCYGRFRDYTDWHTGIEDWFRLITVEYIQQRGFTTIDEVIPIYAPAFENDVGNYTNVVSQQVAEWRVRFAVQSTAHDDAPHGSPLGTAMYELSQGYGVGTHAPAETWGGIDLAAPAGTPIVAVLAGTVRLTTTWPCGNGVEILAEHWRILYCHTGDFILADGMQVQAGQQVAVIGLTGQTTGPHLHFEVWRDGVNVNPLEYL